MSLLQAYSLFLTFFRPFFLLVCPVLIILLFFYFVFFRRRAPHFPSLSPNVFFCFTPFFFFVGKPCVETFVASGSHSIFRRSFCLFSSTFLGSFPGGCFLGGSHGIGPFPFYRSYFFLFFLLTLFFPLCFPLSRRCWHCVGLFGFFFVEYSNVPFFPSPSTWLPPAPVLERRLSPLAVSDEVRPPPLDRSPFCSSFFLAFVFLIFEVTWPPPFSFPHYYK